MAYDNNISNSPILRVTEVGRDGQPDNTGYLNGTSSQSVKAGPGQVLGIAVNSHTNGTIKLWDNTAGSGTVILNTVTFAAGPTLWTLPSGGVNFNTGLFITVGGTIDYTVFYQ